jgi:putative resolvase
MIGRTVNNLQRWDRKGILKAYRSPTNRRYYTHDQDLAYRGLLVKASGKVNRVRTGIRCRAKA